MATNQSKPKIVTINQGLELINSGDNIIVGMGAAEPKELLTKLHTIAGRVKDVRIATCLTLTKGQYLDNPQCHHSFFSDSLFNTGLHRGVSHLGRVSYIPQHLSKIVRAKLLGSIPNVFIACGSIPDKHGYISLLSATYERKLMESCDRVIIEINPNCPRTFGENQIHISEVTHLIEVDYPMAEIPRAIPSLVEEKIAENIVELIEDGSCIQLGIGGTPAAVAKKLEKKKNLGIHTEMFTSEMVDLIESGAVNGWEKQVDNRLHVCSFAAGDKKLYDFLHDNPSVEFRAAERTIEPYVMSKNHKQISINGALSIDLTGQVCSESIGSRHFSGTGGQSDTARGAALSKGGKSFVAIQSTATLKNKETGESTIISKIRPMLTEGSVVSLHRNDVQYIVTEYGAAYLEGLNIAERAEALISIAHPMFREELTENAKNIGYIF